MDTRVCYGGTITFGPSVTSITLASELHITRPMTISGPGAATLTISGNAVTRIFRVNSGQTVNISGITMTNGSVVGANGSDGGDSNGADASGGAISNAGTLTLTNMIISNSHVTGGDGENGGTPGWNGGHAKGGGIYNSGTLTLSNSTISGGSATGGKGGDSNTANGNGGSGFG